MIRDLKASEERLTRCHAQVCIIGAGTAGIFLAHQLRKLGIRVVMLEAGSQSPAPSAQQGHYCVQRGLKYQGAESGRSFGVGGTSVLWGGQMLPLAPSDLEDRPWAGTDAWPLEYDDLAAFFPEVCKALGIDNRNLFDCSAEEALLAERFPALQTQDGDFDLRLSAWLPFRKRNMAKAFKSTLDHDEGLTLWLNAAVVEMKPDSGVHRSRVESVIARSANGNTVEVHAGMVVVASGALESTRLLLAFDESTSSSITSDGAPLGRFFGDHLSVTCGRFVCRDWRLFNQAVGPIFERGLMRTPRLELSRRAQEDQRLNSAFAHFTFVTKGDTGFDMVRRVLRRRQGERLTTRFSLPLLAGAVADVSSMAFWRFVHRRLWIPRSAELLLLVDIEQTPNPNSRLCLADERDEFGRKRLVIDWQITPGDVRVVREVAALAVQAWQRAGLSKAADLELTLPDDLDSFKSLYDVYHPTGSIRMGRTRTDSVVDKDLRLWAADNVYVTTTAVFPSAGSANPGFTHLALTARLAQHLAQRSEVTA